MAGRRSRKRRASQVFNETEPNDQEVPQQPEPELKESIEDSPDRLEKEQQIWDTIREEHFEVVEQMPLTLHRQFALLRELDEQAHAYTTDLLPTLQRYIRQRQSMASQPRTTEEDNNRSIGDAMVVDSEPHEQDAVPKQERASTPPRTTAALVIPNGTPSSSRARESASPSKAGLITPLRKVQTASISTPRTPTPMGIPPERVKPPETTREMLSHIAWLTEELQRASREKVNLAKAATDSVDRHIRLLDQAIKEQEAVISVGVQSGTHPAAILLPDLVVPRWGRPSRHTHSPIPGDEAGEVSDQGNNGDDENGATLGIVASGAPPEGARTRPRRRARWHKKPVKKKPEQEPLEEKTPRRGVRSSLKITVPAITSGIPPADMPIDPNEPRYCFCNQVSYGDMVACDNPDCEREWFHLGCVDMTEAPKAKKKWYCRECAATTTSRRRK